MKRRLAPRVRNFGFFVVLGVLAFTVRGSESGDTSFQESGTAIHDPWTPDRLMPAEDLSRILSDPAAKKPQVFQIGIQYLYRNAHITGSSFIGTASSPDGLEKLRDDVRKLPPDTEIVLYCGCCPWDVCPNTRPAYKALSELGFRNVKVLHLPQNLHRDWVQRKFPTEKRAAAANGKQD